MVRATAAKMEELMADYEHDILARRPEKLLVNDCVLIMTIIEKLATNAAYLALTWSTVVLLGGFVSDLKYDDFWYLTSISMVFAIGILPTIQYPVASIYSMVTYYVRMHVKLEAMEQRYSHRFPILCLKLLSVCLAAFSATVCLLFSAASHIIVLGPAVSMMISLMRLIQKDYGGGDKRAKLTAAMNIFYSLAVVQGLLFYLWCLIFLASQTVFPRFISRKCGFGRWGLGVVMSYSQETKNMCRRDGTLPWERNIITYAVGLLEKENPTPDVYLRGARILDTFVRDKIAIDDGTVSKLAIQNLIQVLGWRNQQQHVREMKERAARIVTHFTSNLFIDEFPGALRCIGSLLETPQPNTQAGNKTTMELKGKGLIYQGVLFLASFLKGPAAAYTPTEELVLQGLLLLERLTQHQDNCKEICDNESLLSMIMSPLSSLDIEHDAEILIGTLRVVTGLVSAPGESTRILRKEISSNLVLVADIQRVMEDKNAAPGLRTAIIEVLTVLASDLAMSHESRERFILVAKNMFLGDMAHSSNQADEEASRLMMKRTGEALVKMLSVWGVTTSSVFMSMLPQNSSLVKLTEILVETSVCQTSAAQILEHFCLHWTQQERISLLETALVLILGSQTKANEPSSENSDDQSEERKWIAALLSLTVTIWDNLHQNGKLSSLALADDSLIKKLKEIVARNNDATTDCLRVIKLTCQLVILMVRHKPSWIKCFEECEFTESLSAALKALGDVDKCKLFAASSGEAMKPARPLSSLVKEARQLLENAAPPQSIRISIP